MLSGCASNSAERSRAKSKFPIGSVSERFCCQTKNSVEPGRYSQRKTTFDWSSGRYALSTHNGDVTVTVAEGTSASVSVSTFNGEFESAFPVTLTETRKGKRFNFTIGGGSAQVTLESFQGTIQLVRPGEFRGAHEDDEDDR